MVGVLGILAVSLVIAIIEVPSLLKKKLRRELWVFSILLLIGTGLSIAKSLKVEILNPFDLMAAFYKPFSDMLFQLLE